MKISAIKTFVLSAELQTPFGFSQWYYERKSNILIQIQTDEGITGWGECYGPASLIASAIQDFYAQRLLNWDPCCIEQIWNHLWQSSLDFARKGILMSAISGIDMALWDIRGKVLQQPLRLLLGGNAEFVECYATGMYFRKGMDENALIQILLKEGEGYINEGFAVLKIKIGKNMPFDLKLIRAFRKAFPNTLLAADSNHAYSYKEALKVGHVLEENDYLWFEEPVSPENVQDYALLRKELAIPISGGECEQTRFGFLNLLSQGALDIAQPDLAYAGGISEFLKIHSLASAYHTDVLPHCWGLRCNQAAAGSVMTILAPNPGRLEKRTCYLEMDRTEHPVRDGIFSTSHELKGGRLHFNPLPGLGVVVDEKKLKQYLS